MKIEQNIALFIKVFILSLFLAGCQGDKDSKKSSIPVGSNLLKNPGFEDWTDSLPEHWKIRNMRTLGIEVGRHNLINRSDESNKGKYCCHFSADDSTKEWTVLTQNIPVISGDKIILSSNVMSRELKPMEQRRNFSNVYVIFMNEKGERVNRDSKRLFDGITRRCRGNVKWSERKKRIDIPEEASYAEVGIISSMSGDMYFDNVSAIIEKGPPWQKTETDYIEFYSLPGHPLPEEDLRKEAELIESYAAKIDLKAPEKKIKYYYYPTEDDFKRIKMEEDYFQSVKWKKKEIHTIEKYEDMVMTHLLIADLGRPPTGLIKGVVFYLRSDEHNWDPHKDTKKNLLNHQVPALYKTINNDQFLDMDLSVVVPAWTSFCSYLIDQFGVEKFMKFYREADDIQNLPPFEVLFRVKFGKEFKKTDMDWRMFVLRYQPEGESTPMP